ncbi:MAG TPA: hypothetical protein VEJ63_07520 [Planctomycetota bacterium]|nr:hypothetical protein [Planctomycetota bacterium]
MRFGVIFFSLALLLAGGTPAADTAPVVVSNVKVLSDKVEDVSSAEAWVASVIKPGMTDEQKALAIFDAVVKFRHHDMFPAEWDGDAIKQFNVYGYGPAPTSMLHLARAAGFKARGQSLHKWGGGTEFFYDNDWHYLDGGMIAYFKRADGKIASVADIRAEVKAWYEKNPDYLIKNPGDKAEIDAKVNKLKAFIKDPGIAKGPEILTRAPTMSERGSFTLDYFGWYTSMLLFDGNSNTPFVYEEAYTAGYRVNNQLRPGEKLIRNWSNKGLHADMKRNAAPEALNAKVGTGSFMYHQKLGDLSNGRVGNGVLEYSVPLDETRFNTAVLAKENLKSDGKSITLADGAKDGVFILRRPCSYIYLTGTLEAAATLGNGGSISVELSTDNGLKWKPAGTIGAGESKLDLSELVYAQYDYRLKFTLKGAGTAISRLKLTNDIQHSQRPLPALDKGENKISFSAGPHEGTITVQVKTPATAADVGATIEGNDENILKQWGTISPAGGKTTVVTIPIETPGDMTRVRFGCDYRANDKNEGWDLEVSFDDGKSFKKVGRTEGATKQSYYSVSADAPKGARKAIVRYSGAQTGSLVIWRMRVDADYAEPAGGFAPVKITYEFEDGGKPRAEIFVAKTPQESFTIQCGAKPVMKSITLELE